jgi:DNA repair exonuclease SbcCD nuclease subunit
VTSFSFLHAADIHLDSPLKGLARQEGRAAERIRTATRDAFDGLITEAIRESVDFLVISGDLYDGDWKDYQTGLFFVRQMGRLAEAGVDVLLLHGNHDAQSKMTHELRLPSNVRVFAAKAPETVLLPELDVALHGQSFATPDVSGNLVPAYPEPVAGFFNIGVLHTALSGREGHDTYAPCSLEELVARGYDYWALGHVHRAEVVHESPHVVFPGNLQGRHIRETGPKGAVLVVVEDGRIVERAPVVCDVVRWALVKVAVGGCEQLAEVEDRVRTAIEEEVANESDGRLMACRVVLTGRSSIHDRLLVSQPNLQVEAEAVAAGLGEEAAWIEKLIVTTEPMRDPAASRASEDALGELERILEHADSDSELQEKIAADIGEMIAKLPPDIRSDTDDDVLQAAMAGDFATVIRRVSPYLSARITAETE